MLKIADYMKKAQDSFIETIIDNLKTIDPERIILIGSHAAGTCTADSDIDLVVILDTDKLPANYDEKLDMKVAVRDCIYELSKKYPIDLIIYTRGEFNKLGKLKTSFYNEIVGTGKVLYEKAS